MGSYLVLPPDMGFSQGLEFMWSCSAKVRKVHKLDVKHQKPSAKITIVHDQSGHYIFLFCHEYINFYIFWLKILIFYNHHV